MRLIRRAQAEMPDWFGALAQLGERFAGSEEVRSSILLGSTKPSEHVDFA